MAIKIICPECGSQYVMFGKDFLHYRYWRQEPSYSTVWSNYEYGDSGEECEDDVITCTCDYCEHSWIVEGPLELYLDQG